MHVFTLKLSKSNLVFFKYIFQRTLNYIYKTLLVSEEKLYHFNLLIGSFAHRSNHCCWCFVDKNSYQSNKYDFFFEIRRFFLNISIDTSLDDQIGWNQSVDHRILLVFFLMMDFHQHILFLKN